MKMELTYIFNYKKHRVHVRYWKNCYIVRGKCLPTYKKVQLVQTQHQCDGRAAKRTATTLFVDCVGAYLFAVHEHCSQTV